MNAVDKYVVYDDVNFIKGGWINRNRILLNGQTKYINVPMIGSSSFKHINEIGVNTNIVLAEKNLRMIESAYRKAPYYELVYPLISDVFRCNRGNLVDYLMYSFVTLCDYLDIKTQLIISSSLEKNCELTGQDKVLEICKILNASEYYNAVGGQELYSFNIFAQNGIKLKFLQTNHIEYKQYSNEFQSNLSIIDVLMFNSREQIKEMLEQYTLKEA